MDKEMESSGGDYPAALAEPDLESYTIRLPVGVLHSGTKPGKL